MPKGEIYSQLRRVDRRLWNTSAICWYFYEKMVNFLLVYLICGSKILCSTSCQQEIFGRKIFCGNKFSRAGVWSQKSQKFLPCENFPLYGTCTRPEMLSPSCYYSRNVARMKPLYMVRRAFSKPFVVGKKKPPTRCQTAFYCRYPKQLPCA